MPDRTSEELVDAMAAFEACCAEAMPAEIRWAALAGLGSKYLAVGSPDSIGLIDCGSAAARIVACHSILFGDLHIKLAGHNELLPGTAATACDPEEAFACDIVCAPCTVDLDLAWIAEATHLNVRYQEPGPSAGVRTLLQAASVTVESSCAGELPRRHGSVDEVITGQVSGRLADELTVLLHD